MKTKLENNMEEIFDIDEETSPIIDVIAESKEVATVEDNAVVPAEPEAPVSERDKDIESDYRFVRKNLRDIITSTQDSIEDISMVAQTSESPRAYEVLGNLVKTLVDANQSLLDLQKKVKDIKEETPEPVAPVTNALFVGSTSELMKMIKGEVPVPNEE